MKKIISLLLTAIVVLSSLNVVFAAEIPTVTLGNVDATAVEAGGNVIIPVTIDKFPEGSLDGVELKVTFDNTKLEFSRARNKDADGNASMKVYFLEDPEYPEEAQMLDATWTYPKNDALTEMNENGTGSVLYIDMDKIKPFTSEQSLAQTNVLVYLYFKKVNGATGTTTVDLSDVGLVDIFSNSNGNEYWMSRNEVIGKSGTVTFTTSSGPVDTIETVATDFEGDNDATDTATAVFAELNGDAEKTYKTVNWSVSTAAKTNTYTQNVNVSGEATYKFGLVLRGLVQSTVTEVNAALAE